MANKILQASLFFFLLHTHESGAMVTMKSLCPNEFKARVESVLDERGPSLKMPMERVSFTEIVELRGRAPESLRIVKDGPVKFVKGEVYHLQTRGEWLCHSEE